ncbi:hypothetical protein C8R44DRAFT_876589 [Mycena epipterygia]|nr:hypothetical protein C8R44DRAFT_876589 [Mycena epipterygia]
MSFAPLRKLYRLAGVLSFLQITSGLATIYLYGLEEGASINGVQLLPTTYATVTGMLMLAMDSGLHDAENNLWYWRVDVDYRFLLGLLMLWVFFGAGAWAYVAVYSRTLSATIASCMSDAFLTPKCIPIAMDILLPYAIMITLYSAAKALKRSARDLRGRR